MKPLNEVLSEINKAIEQYEVCRLNQTQHQGEILRALSVNLHWLAEHRIEAHEKWLSVYFKSTGTSSAAKEREADSVVRELYQIRRMMDSASKVMDSLRSTISINKSNN